MLGFNHYIFNLIKYTPYNYHKAEEGIYVYYLWHFDDFVFYYEE